MPNIILKKTFKVKPSGFQVANEKTFSFHGAITPDMIEAVNQKLVSLRLYGKSSSLRFTMDQAGIINAP